MFIPDLDASPAQPYFLNMFNKPHLNVATAIAIAA